MTSRQSHLARNRRSLLVGMLVMCLAVVGALGASAGTADTVENVTLYSTDQSDFADSETLHSAIENGTLDSSETVVVGGTLVVAIDSRRLATDIDKESGSPTAGFFAALDDDADIMFAQSNHGPNVQPKVINLGPDNTTVYRHNTTTYLTIETGALAVTRSGSRDSSLEASIERGDVFVISVGYDDTVSVSSSPVEFQLTKAAFVESTDVLAPEVLNTTIRVAAEPDSELAVRATFSDGTEITEQLTEPSSSHRRQVSLDLRDVTPGMNYTLELVFDGEVVDTTAGVVRELNATLSDASVHLLDTGENVARVDVTASLSHGGTVVVLDEYGAQIAATAVQSGTETELSILFEIPDQGTDFDTDSLRIVAVREGERVDQQYPGPGAQLTLDVSEIDWDRSEWTPAEPTDTATPQSGSSGTPGETDTAGSGTDADDENLTVGEGPPESGTEFATPVSQVGVAGVLCLLAGLGYVVRRRLRNS